MQSGIWNYSAQMNASAVSLASRIGVSTPTIDDQLGEAALLLLRALSGTASWVHRRVERIDFQERGFSRTVNLEYDSPSGDGKTPIPVLLIPKAESASVVRARNERNEELPSLTAAEAGAVALTAIRCAIAENGRQPSASEKELLSMIVAGTRHEARTAWRHLQVESPTWLDDWRISTLCDMLCDARLWCVFVESDSQRHVLTLEWAGHLHPGGRPTIRQMLDPNQGIAIQTVPGASPASSYHLEVTPPPGLEIKQVAVDNWGAHGELNGSCDPSRLHLYQPGDEPAVRLLHALIGPPTKALNGALVAAMWTLGIAAFALARPGIGALYDHLLELALVPLLWAILSRGLSPVRSVPGALGTVLALACAPSLLLIVGVLIAGAETGVLAVATAFAGFATATLSRWNFRDVLQRRPVQ